MAMATAKILVVDDDNSLLELLSMRLESAQYEVGAALNEQEALARAQDAFFDLAVVDLKLAGHDGLVLMEQLHAMNPEMPVIILTAHGSIESAVEAMKRGAYSYVTKPFDPRELLLQIDRALENRRLTSEVKRLKGLVEERYSFAGIVGKSEPMQRVLEVVSRIAKTDSTVFIHGESGTGKELVAKAVHLASARSDQPFVAINCAALPEALLESELFGHEKGAFTGAIRSTKGLFTQAHKGTLFLDEIADMPLSLQAKLLRALQERQFYPVGSDQPVAVDVRVIVATRRDLEGEVKQGLFREDLFYRIHVIPIRLAPLRDRKEDIPPLADHFIRRFSQQMHKDVKGLTPPAMRKLMRHSWPGNVRELENTIEYAIAMTQEDILGEELVLPAHLEPSGPNVSYETPLRSQDDPPKPLREAKDEFEKDYLIRLLEMSKGNVSQAAKLAGKYRADFYDLLKKHGLKAESFKEPK